MHSRERLRAGQNIFAILDLTAAVPTSTAAQRKAISFVIPACTRTIIEKHPREPSE